MIDSKKYKGSWKLNTQYKKPGRKEKDEDILWKEPKRNLEMLWKGTFL